MKGERLPCPCGCGCGCSRDPSNPVCWLCTTGSHKPGVVLAPEDAARADAVGDARFDRAVGRGRRDRGGVNERASHRFGARAELAAARLLGIRWPATVDVFTSVPDLPPDIEVRGSRSSRDLKLRDKDMLSERRYVVVVNDGNRWRFTGWLRGTEAASMGLVAQRRRADLAPAFWVPADRLHSPGEFVRAT